MLQIFRKKFLPCLTILCLFGLLLGCSSDKDSLDISNDAKTNDYPPMVMFNDNLYTAASFDYSKLGLEVVGEITSFISNGIPTENNQANDNLVGCKIYASSEMPDYIFVLYDGNYCIYKKQTN